MTRERAEGREGEERKRREMRGAEESLYTIKQHGHTHNIHTYILTSVSSMPPLSL
jgi:hypothetical protein